MPGLPHPLRSLCPTRPPHFLALSYNRINGTHACENSVTLGDLKSPKGLNFSGWVLSDWGGVHSTVPSALAGLDVEMPGDSYFGSALLAAVQSGQVPLSNIDDKVLRVLRPMFAQGLFDIPQQGHADSNVTSDRHNALARDLAAAGTVLLVNKPGVLPLSNSVATITVVGTAAHDKPYPSGTGSGGLSLPYLIDPLEGIAARAGPGCNVTYMRGITVFQNITQFFSPSRGDHYIDFACEECGGLYTEVRVEGMASDSPCPQLDCIELDLWYNVGTQGNLILPKGMDPPMPSTGYQYVRVLGYALPLNYSGPVPTATLELWKGMDTPTGQPANSHLDFWTLASDASRAAAAAAGYTKVAAIGRLALASLAPTPQPITSEKIIIVVSTGSGEGSDRPTLNLTAEDTTMVSQVLAAHPGEAVVVINGPAAVTMPWAADAGAIIMQWYPGQEMGNALADILWGDVNPSGRLPVTFPTSDADSPLHSAAQYPGVDGVVNYTEKLLIGYRYWDSENLVPLFPFGS
jgi:beta-glucosidase